MATALDAMLGKDNDLTAARRFSDQMIHMLQDFIPESCRRDAWQRLCETAFEQKFELTTFAMRKQYEAWKSTQIDALHLGRADTDNG